MLSISSLLLMTSILSLWQIPESHSRSSISISSGDGVRVIYCEHTPLLQSPNSSPSSPGPRASPPFSRVGLPAQHSRTVPQELQQRQVDGPLPAGALVKGDAIASGSEDLAGADGDQLASLILACHVVEHCRIIDEGIQFPEDKDMKDRKGNQPHLSPKILSLGWERSREVELPHRCLALLSFTPDLSFCDCQPWKPAHSSSFLAQA
ncbi:hypothetical protein LEMLEM_LOCUS21990 [Lemmus lemmus]